MIPYAPHLSRSQMLAERLSLYFQAYTLYSSVRPFGLSALVAGWDSPADPSKAATGSPQLFCVEPSGVYWGYRGVAIGKGRQLAKTEIEKLKLDELTAEEALQEAARIIHLVHDEAKDKDFELELSWISPASGYKHKTVPKELADKAEARAKEILDEANQMED